MKILSILDKGNIRILLYLYDKEARYSELLKNVVTVRSTLSYMLVELMEEKLINRRVLDTQPIQVKYFLTEKGRKVAECFFRIREFLMER